MDDFQPPPGHPISIERAKELMSGPLADVYRKILAKCCAPIFWYRNDHRDLPIINNGTVTFLKTPEKLLGVTAAHVLLGYLDVKDDRSINLQIFDHRIDALADKIIDINERLDIGTFEVDASIMDAIGKSMVPLGNWPPRPPQEGRGIMLAGYPGRDTMQEPGRRLNFGLFTALVIARTVTDMQITWLIERDKEITEGEISPPPPNYVLGGISGGPLITWIESDSGIATFALGGIITEHPDYGASDISIERVISIRADFIGPSGRIRSC